MTKLTKGRLICFAAILIDVGAPLAATMCYFPIWVEKSAEATISGAFDTTAYSVSYTPTEGGAPVTDHRWVVHEELVDPGQAPLPNGASVVLDAEHMSGMKGAEATIDYSTEETVYMVDLTVDGMTMTNHKWVTESEIQPAE